MLAFTRLKHDAPALVKRAQADPVFGVQRLFAHRDDCFGICLLTLTLFLVVRNSVGPEPGALFGNDGAVLREVDEHKVFKLREPRGVCRVVQRGHFIVDGPQEVVRFQVLYEPFRVTVILGLKQFQIPFRLEEMGWRRWAYLHQVFLRPFGIHAGARCIPPKLAKHVMWLTRNI
jgi:hypothetical protein